MTITQALVMLYFKFTPLISTAFIVEWMDSGIANLEIIPTKLIEFFKFYFLVYNYFFIIIITIISNNF